MKLKSVARNRPLADALELDFRAHREGRLVAGRPRNLASARFQAPRTKAARCEERMRQAGQATFMLLRGQLTAGHRTSRCMPDMWGSLWGFPDKASEV